MILHQLVEYSKREGFVDESDAFEDGIAQWMVIIGDKGEFQEILWAGTIHKKEIKEKQKVKIVEERKPRPINVCKKIGPTSGSAAVPNFLTNTIGRYLLPEGILFGDHIPEGRTSKDITEKIINKEQKAIEKRQKDHDYLVVLHQELATECHDIGAQALYNFLLNRFRYKDIITAWAIDNNVKIESEKVCFSLFTDLNIPINERREIQKWWINRYNDFITTSSEQLTKVPCLNCGNIDFAQNIHNKIKGVPDAQPSGALLISFNFDASTSYGFSQSANAALCGRCMNSYTLALNRLISDKKNSIYTGKKSILVTWTKEKVSFNPISLINEAKIEDVLELLKSVFSGKVYSTDLDDNNFYALHLASNNARISVLDYLEIPLNKVKENLVRWFSDGALFNGYETKYFQLRAYRRAVGPKPKKDWEKRISPKVGLNLVQSALTGKEINNELFMSALQRNRTDPPTTRDKINQVDTYRHHARISLIKIFLNRTIFKGDNPMEERLDVTRKDPAYICGRLLAILEYAQERAVPSINETLVDKYYGTASSSPASVFPRILRTYRHHIQKLKKESNTKGTAVYLEKLVSEILNKFDSFPHTLDMNEQGIFALGYYHQRSARYKKKENEQKTKQEAEHE